MKKALLIILAVAVFTTGCVSPKIEGNQDFSSVVQETVNIVIGVTIVVTIIVIIVIGINIISNWCSNHIC